MVGELGEFQRAIIQKMREGWVLGITAEVGTKFKMSDKAWLEQGGFGRNGKRISLGVRTVKNLVEKGWVAPTHHVYPHRLFALTQYGKTIPLK